MLRQNNYILGDVGELGMPQNAVKLHATFPYNEIGTLRRMHVYSNLDAVLHHT
jgi:hypothetical protein